MEIKKLIFTKDFIITSVLLVFLAFGFKFPFYVFILLHLNTLNIILKKINEKNLLLFIILVLTPISFFNHYIFILLLLFHELSILWLYKSKLNMSKKHLMARVFLALVFYPFAFQGSQLALVYLVLMNEFNLWVLYCKLVGNPE